MDNEKTRQVLISDIQSNIKKEKEKTQLDNQEKIRILNEKRFQIMEAEDKVLQEKAFLAELRKKG